MITAYLGRLAAGQDLTLAEMSQVIDQVMSGQVPANEIAVLLTALRAKGETVDEIAGAALAMRKHMTPIRTRRTGLVDTCGTGGIGSDLFNISTAAAIVTAAAGVPVAKHGNRSITSKSGSADVLAALGVNVDAPPATVERCLDELGICFCFAPRMHPAMKHVAAVRKQLGIPTIFNLLGPLCNPAGAPFQLLGVGKRELHETMAAALARLGTEHAVVVHGTDGLGEVSLTAPTEVIEVRNGQLNRFVWQASDFAIAEPEVEILEMPNPDPHLLAKALAVAQRYLMRVSSPADSAALIRQVLDGQRGPAVSIVVMNAAAALWVGGMHASAKQCAVLAATAIDSGAARELLARWVELSGQSAANLP